MRPVRRLPPWSGLLVAVGIAPVFGGCSSTHVRPVAADLLPISATSWSTYNDALLGWAQINADGLGGEERANALMEVYISLRQAQENAGESPLLQTKMATLLMEIGPAEDGVAEQHLLRAIAKEPDWAPAWYEAAWLVLRRDDPSPQELSQAEGYVAEFEAAMERLITWNPAPHDEDYVAESEPEIGFYDKELGSAARQQEFLTQISSYLDWRKTNTILLNQPRNTGSLGAGGAGSRGWARSLKARAKFLKLLIEARYLDYVNGAPSQTARLQELAMLLKEEVLPMDGDLVHPRRVRAEILHALSFHTEASDVIRGLVDRGGAMLQNDPELLFLAIQIHVDWLMEALEASGESLSDSVELQTLNNLVCGYAERLIGEPRAPDAAIAPGHRGGFARVIAGYLALLEHAIRTQDDRAYQYAATAAEDYIDAATRRLPEDSAEVDAMRQRLAEIKSRRNG